MLLFSSGLRWVGYDGEGFEGQQFVLEEGEYLDWTDWGGTGEKLLSLRRVFTVSLLSHQSPCFTSWVISQVVL